MTPPDGGHNPALSHELGYFAKMYAGDDDPWGFDSQWYEQRKYALTMAALPRPRFRRALEPGCANGALTELLAGRCDELIAYDVIDDAVRRARRRLAGHAHVAVQLAPFPDYWPSGTGDLVVWSEVAYYLTQQGAEIALAGLQRWLEPCGTLVAVHYTGLTDYPRTGYSIATWLDGAAFLERATLLTDAQFQLGVWQRPRDAA